MRLTVLRVPVGEAELASDRLWAAGARAVEELAPSADGETVELRTVLAADDEVSAQRIGDIPPTWTMTFEDADDEPSEAWREHAAPVQVNDRLVLVPAWIEVPPAAPGTMSVVVEPAGSFGLGDHPTTRLSADAVWRLAGPGDRVLDVGCGSGVLSVIAALRGADGVVAVDIAEAAREATVANAARNGVAERVDASTTPVGDIDGEYELVVANILAPTLVAMAADLVRLTTPGGRLVISGILAEAHEHVLAALRPLVPLRTDELDRWVAVELAHR